MKAFFKKTTVRIGLALLLFLGLLAGIYATLDHRGFFFYIAEATPQGEIKGTSNITIRFSQPVVSSQALDKEIKADFLAIDPPLAGTAKWVLADTLRFYPVSSFLPATHYRVKIREHLVEGKWFPFFRAHSFEFSTPMLQVESLNASPSSIPGDASKETLSAVLQWNYPVDPKALEGKLTWTYVDLKHGEMKLKMACLEKAPDAAIRFVSEPIASSKVKSQLLLQVESGVVSSVGGSPLAKDIEIKKEVNPLPTLKLEKISAAQEVDQPEIEIAFGIGVEADRVAPYISVTPDVGHRVIQSSYDTVSLVGAFEAGKSYRVVLKKDLPGNYGFPLEEEISQTLSFGDLNPYLAFTHKGVFLPRRGGANLSLTTVNLPRVRVEVRKIFPKNLVHFLKFGLTEEYGDSESEWDVSYSDAFGETVFSELVDLSGEKNKKLDTLISLNSFLEAQDQGFYVLTVRKEDERWERVEKWLVVTDLGLIVKQSPNRLFTFVHSFSDLSAVPGAKVVLLSESNQELASAETGPDGLSIIDDLKKKVGASRPALVRVEKGKDVSFLDLRKDFTNLTDFDVGGEDYLTEGYEIYMYGDRDLYRPGDRAHLVGYIRGEKMQVPEKFPLAMSITSPRGSRFLDLVVTPNANGAFESDIEIPADSATGLYQVEVGVSKDKPIGRYAFRVEDFIPLRTKVVLSSDKKVYEPGEEIAINLTASNLFGPPAVDRKTKLSVALTRGAFESAAFPNFIFGDSGLAFESVEADLGELKTDEKGEVKASFAIPEDLPKLPLIRATVGSQVSEAGGGRTVDTHDTVDIYPTSQILGLYVKPEIEDGGKSRTPIEVMALNREGETLADVSLSLKLYKRTWHSIVEEGDHGRLRYVSEPEDTLVLEKELTSAQKPVSFAFEPNAYGTYVAELASDEGAPSKVTFSHYGWGQASWDMTNPDRLTMKLDKKVYSVGETATLTIQAPFSGKLLLTAEGYDVLDHQTEVLEGNTAVIKIPVTEAYAPNAYLVGTLIRSAKSLEKLAPALAVGVVPLAVDPSVRKFDIALKAPGQMRPEQSLTVEFETKVPLDKVTWTLAAVDEGILNLTGFKTPNPLDYFFSKRRLGISTFDIYAGLMPEIPGIGIPLKVGGDAGRLKNLNLVSARRVKPVALWSGLLESDQLGRGKATLQVPEFNGTLRLMAVAGSGANFASAESRIVVRNPVVMTPEIPRFLAPLDQVVIPVQIQNGTGSAGEAQVTLETTDNLEIVSKAVQSIDIPRDGERRVEFILKAKEAVGKSEIKLTARIGDEVDASTTELSIRPAAQRIVKSGSGRIEAGHPVTIDLPKAFVPGLSDAQVSVAGPPEMGWAGSLAYLLQYPYGCLEQLTSKLFPLLYFKDIAAKVSPQAFKDTAPDYFISEGISRIESLQSGGEGFGYWPGMRPSSAYTWSETYACDFLAEAKARGYNVRRDTLDHCETYLRKVVYRDVEESEGLRWGKNFRLENQVYASLVLTRLGHKDRGYLLYLKDSRIEEVPTFSRYQLAKALALVGDVDNARGLLLAKFVPPTGPRESGGNFNSPVKSFAIMLDALLTVAPESPDIPVIVNELVKARKALGDDGHFGNTQEDAFALLALGKYFKDAPTPDFEGKSMLKGELLSVFDESGLSWTGHDVAGQPLSLSIEGKGPAYYYWSIEGIADKAHALEEADHGLRVRRRLLSSDGKDIDPAKIKQGDLVIVDVSLENLDDTVENFAVVDLLPAGFEIENPRLGAKDPMAWMPKDKLSPDYVDMRDDRLLFFVRTLPKKPLHFYYGVRAVSRGQFVLPVIKAESMYRPDISSTASGGAIEIE